MKSKMPKQIEDAEDKMMPIEDMGVGAKVNQLVKEVEKAEDVMYGCRN